LYLKPVAEASTPLEGSQAGWCCRVLTVMLVIHRAPACAFAKIHPMRPHLFTMHAVATSFEHGNTTHTFLHLRALTCFLPVWTLLPCQALEQDTHQVPSPGLMLQAGSFQAMLQMVLCIRTALQAQTMRCNASPWHLGGENSNLQELERMPKQAVVG
jgi:hypothetical protein